MEFLNCKSTVSIVFLVVYKSIEFTTVFSEWIALPWFEFDLDVEIYLIYDRFRIDLVLNFNSV